MLALRPLCTTLALAAVALWAAPASAYTVTGQNYGSDVSAEVVLAWDGSDTLTLTIENTSNDAVLDAAFVTGFAFALPHDVSVSLLAADFSASGTLDDAAWHVLDANPSGGPGNAPGGYSFDAGVGTGNNVAGGTALDGFGIGDTATFTVVLTGNTAAFGLADLTGELADGDSGPTWFGVRFQAVEELPGVPAGAGSDFAIVPEPSLGLLLLTAAVGLLLLTAAAPLLRRRQPRLSGARSRPS